MEKVTDKKKILIVDDDRDVIKKRRAFLSDLGHDVLVAYDGEEALNVLNKETGIDLMVLDLDMPKMRGDEVLEEIADDPKFSNIKVMVFTNLGGTSGVLSPQDKKTVTKSCVEGQKNRGWDNRFKFVRKEFTRTNREFLLRVNEMFFESLSIDRPRRKGEPWRILIIDNDKEAVEALADKLKENKDYEVIKTDNGSKALEILSRDPVDIIILDIDIPGTNGQELLEIIKKTFILNEIPTIVNTKVKSWGQDNQKENIKFTRNKIVSEVFYKKKDLGILKILHLDQLSKLVNVVSKLIKEREALGYGYINDPITFFRNVNDEWMDGPIEYYGFMDKPYIDEGQEYLCSYCLEKKKREAVLEKDKKSNKLNERFEEMYTYDPNRLFPYKKFYIYTVSKMSYLCPDCGRKLQKKYVGRFGLYFEHFKELEKKEQEQRRKSRSDNPLRKDRKMNEKLFEEIKRIIYDYRFYTTIHVPDIEPETSIKEDFSSKYFETGRRSVLEKSDIEVEKLFSYIKNKYHIAITEEERAWFDTLKDLVDFVDERIS